MVIPEDMNSFSLGQEISLISVGMLDFLGIFYSHGRLQRSSTRKPNHLRILAVALGWACAEAIAHYFIPLWIGARDIEFSWQYVEMGLLSNINLILYLSSSAAVWLGMRNDLGPVGLSVVVFACISQLLLTSMGNYLKLSRNHASMSVLLVRFLVSLLLLGLVWVNYNVYTRKTLTKKE